MGVERDAADTGSWQGDQIPQQAEHRQHDAGYEEQLPRTVQKKETQGTPAVAKRLQMRSVRSAAVGVQRNGYFGNARLGEARLDDHLGRKFHPGAALIELFGEIARESAQAAINIVDGRTKPVARQHGEHRVAKPTMQEWHCTRQYSPASGFEATALHEVEPLSEPLHELRHLAEVVTVVGVAHDHEPASRGCDASHQRGTVTPGRHWNDARAFSGRDLY